MEDKLNISDRKFKVLKVTHVWSTEDVNRLITDTDYEEIVRLYGVEGYNSFLHFVLNSCTKKSGLNIEVSEQLFLRKIFSYLEEWGLRGVKVAIAPEGDMV